MIHYYVYYNLEAQVIHEYQKKPYSRNEFDLQEEEEALCVSARVQPPILLIQSLVFYKKLCQSSSLRIPSPSSLDLNPLDNWILSVLKQKVYRVDITSMKHMKSRIRT